GGFGDAQKPRFRGGPPPPPAPGPPFVVGSTADGPWGRRRGFFYLLKVRGSWRVGGGFFGVCGGGCVHGDGVRGEPAGGGVRGGGAGGGGDAEDRAGDELLGDDLVGGADEGGLCGAGADLHAGAGGAVRGAPDDRERVGAGD